MAERLFDTLVDDFSARAIRLALETTKGNRTHAARLLGISRPTLLARMEKYGSCGSDRGVLSRFAGCSPTF
nr:helix-turn-helix domain-containing protein [Desulfosoma caldarium]